MNGGRGAKGSINDRLITMMYRNRYKRLQLQKEAYRKPNKIKEKEFLKSIADFDIDNIHFIYPGMEALEKTFLENVLTPNHNIPDVNPTGKGSRQLNEIKKLGDSNSFEELHALSDKFIDVDIANEVFDFDKYYYYEIIAKYTGVGELESKNLIDPKREIEKVDDEVIIVEELTKFISESKVILEEVKSEIAEIKTMVNEQATQEQIAALEERYLKIKAKIEKLKKQYDVVKEKYDFDGFEILSSIKMMSAINDYKDKASLDELETLVDVCKDEINEISSVIIVEKASLGVGENIADQKQEIKSREAKFLENKRGVLYLDDLEKKIGAEAKVQQELMKELEKKLANFTTDVVTVRQVTHNTGKIFGSFLKVAAGILTVPFSGRRVFGTALGLYLISSGINGLRNSFNPHVTMSTEVVNRYTDIEREIINSQDHVKTAKYLIMNSIEQINKFDEEFKEKFSQYADLIPEYRQLERQIGELKTKLNRKKIEISIMSKDLDRQYEENKVKVRKAS